jgi:coenzyme PQQ synthesis protein D (PqqD)
MVDDTPLPKYVRTDAMIPRRVAGETLLVPRAARSISAQRRGAELFVLNDSGDVLWSALETPRSVHDLARNLIETYDISTSQAAADVDVFVQSMLAIGAIAKVNR